MEKEEEIIAQLKKLSRKAHDATANRPLVEHGRWYGIPIQHRGNLLCIVPICYQLKNAPNRLRRLWIN